MKNETNTACGPNVRFHFRGNIRHRTRIEGESIRPDYNFPIQRPKMKILGKQIDAF